MVEQMKTVAMYECASWGPGEIPWQDRKISNLIKGWKEICHILYGRSNGQKRGEENGKC